MSARMLLRQGLAFIRLDVLEDLAYPLSTFFSYSGVVLTVVVQYFVARLVVSGADVGGDYFTFAAIGLAMSASLQRSLNNFGNRLQRVQNVGTLETILMEPMPWTLVPLAMSAWHLVSAVIAALLVLLVAGALGATFLVSGVPGFVLVLILSLGAGASIGIASGALLMLTKRGSPLLTVYGMAATLLGGAIFPLSELPGWLRALSNVIPHAYAIDAAREVLMPVAPEASRGLGAALTGLLVLNIALLPIAVWVFNRSLSIARRRGELGSY